MTASFYQATAEHYIEIDGEGANLFCTIPSEKDMDIRYRLECKESNTGVEVLSCSCPSRKPCKHLSIVQAFWTRIYKSNTAKIAESSKVEEIATALDIPTEEVAKIAEIAAEYKQEIKPKHTDLELPIGPGDTKKDIMRKSSLNGAQQSANFWSDLPSRKAS